LYQRILIILMGRTGSNAIPKWILSQCPNEWNVIYKSDDHIWFPKFFNYYFDKLPLNPEVLRQECVRLLRFKEIQKEHTSTNDDCKIIVYGWRDPWNHFASLLKFWEYSKFMKNKTFNEKIKSIRKEYIPNHKEVLSQALGIKNSLPDNAIFINYNEWFQSLEYRKKIAIDLELPTSEKEINKVWKQSGFEPDNEEAQSLRVFDRWKEYIDNEEYRKLFEDKELVELSKQFWEPPF